MTQSINMHDVISESKVQDLKSRLKNVRWPQEIAPADWSAGVPREFLEPLVDYWLNEYDFGQWRAKLDRYPHNIVTIEGEELHFLHYKSARPDAEPLILTHGWPSSFQEFTTVAELLSNPPKDKPAFHVVVPSLPGHGFSQAPTRQGVDVHSIASRWVSLMEHLGYSQFMAQGGDWGSYVTALLGSEHPEHLKAIHLSMPFAGKPKEPVDLDERDQRALHRMMGFGQKRSGYAAIQSTRPATLAYALSDSPVGQLAWISERFWEWTQHDGDLFDSLSREFILDTVNLYWFTNTAGPSSHLFWESFSDMPDDKVTVPTSCSVTTNDAWMPKAWCEKRFTNLVYWKDLPIGGHFLAAEQPEIFIQEIEAMAERIREEE